jgi:hypothetical protein
MKKNKLTMTQTIDDIIPRFGRQGRLVQKAR